VSAGWRPLVGQIAGAISLVGFLPYAVAILRRRARPNRATWFIWTTVGGLLFASYRTEAGGVASWVPLSDALGPATIAALSLRLGEGGFSRFDRGCLALAAVSILGWAVTGSATVALAINLVIDLLGALPTLWKAYADPASESALTWQVFFGANALNLLAIERWSLAGAAYPLYVVAVSGLVNVVLVLGRFRALRYGET
jgi:hypothetical protein